jgi:hypothetical protein
MTKAKLFALSAFAFTMAFAFYRGYQDYENAQEPDHLLLANIEALAQDGEGTTSGEYSRYINDTKFSSNTEFKTEVNENGVSISWKRTCQSAITYCKNTGDDDDICYESLNGVVTTCGEWSKN